MKIAVHTPFKLSLAGREDIPFTAGIHTVDKEIAEHWFTRAHADVSEGEGAQSSSDPQKQRNKLTRPEVKGHVATEQKSADTGTVQT